MRKRIGAFMKGLLALACFLGFQWALWLPMRQWLRMDEGIVNTLAGALSILALLIFMHYTLQTWRNAGPRDRCKSCSMLLRDESNRAIICPNCDALPNQRRSVWAFWRVVTAVPGRWFRKIRNNYITRSQQTRQIQSICIHCGYDLYGNKSEQCPECGQSMH